MTKFLVFVSTTLVMLQQRSEKKDKGATMVEYGLLVALIAVVVAVAAALLGKQISTLFASVSTSIAG